MINETGKAASKTKMAQTLLGLIRLQGRMITNEIVRSEITDLEASTKKDIAMGKSKYMYSKKIKAEYGKLLKLDKNKLSQKQAKRLKGLKDEIEVIDRLAIKQVKIAEKKEQKLAAINSAMLPANIRIEGLSNKAVMNQMKNVDKAIVLANSLDVPTKGISVWDFDDTLAKTKSNVLYTMPNGTTGKLSAADFAKKGDKMIEDGAEFDFSEFAKVMNGKKGPLFNKAVARNKKFGNKNVYVLTARPAESAIAIHNFLKSEGLNIPLNNITGLGNSDPRAKANWVVSKAAQGYNDFYFADDQETNVNAVDEALNGVGVKRQVELAKAKYSKKIRAEYSSILLKKRGKLNGINGPTTPEEQIDAVFEWVEGLAIPEKNVSKYKRAALNFIANSETVFPEDSEIVSEAIRIGNLANINIMKYNDPRVIIQSLQSKVKAKRLDPNEIPAFINKKSLPEGVEIFQMNNSEAALGATRAIMDSHWGEDANPWCNTFAEALPTKAEERLLLENPTNQPIGARQSIIVEEYFTYGISTEISMTSINRSDLDEERDVFKNGRGESTVRTFPMKFPKRMWKEGPVLEWLSYDNDARINIDTDTKADFELQKAEAIKKGYELKFNVERPEFDNYIATMERPGSADSASSMKLYTLSLPLDTDMTQKEWEEGPSKGGAIFNPEIVPTGDREITANAWENWQNYGTPIRQGVATLETIIDEETGFEKPNPAYQKTVGKGGYEIAFKDGKLLSLRNLGSYKQEWWDRVDYSRKDLALKVSRDADGVINGDAKMMNVETGETYIQPKPTNKFSKKIKGSLDSVVQQLSDIKSETNLNESINDEDAELLENKAALSRAKYSKKLRVEYQRILSKRRTDIPFPDVQIDEVFDWTKSLNLPDKDISKYKKTALHYIANSNVIFPEDADRVAEAIRIAEIKNINPMDFNNPNSIIENFKDNVNVARLKPDNVPEFFDKKSFSEGIETFKTLPNKEGQKAVRAIMDTHWGEDSNPWCVTYAGRSATEEDKEAEEFAPPDLPIGTVLKKMVYSTMSGGKVVKQRERIASVFGAGDSDPLDSALWNAQSKEVQDNLYDNSKWFANQEAQYSEPLDYEDMIVLDEDTEEDYIETLARYESEGYRIVDSDGEFHAYMERNNDMDVDDVTVVTQFYLPEDPSMTQEKWEQGPAKGGTVRNPSIASGPRNITRAALMQWENYGTPMRQGVTATLETLFDEETGIERPNPAYQKTVGEGGFEIAFKNGRLLGLKNLGSNQQKWWDRNDHPTTTLPIKVSRDADGVINGDSVMMNTGDPFIRKERGRDYLVKTGDTYVKKYESVKYSKKVDSNFNNIISQLSSGGRELNFGSTTSEDQRLFNYDFPIASKKVNDSEIRIVNVAGKTNAYHVYVDGKIVKETKSIADAKKASKSIEQKIKKLPKSQERFNNQSKETKEILDVIDVKGPTQKSRVRYSPKIDRQFNHFLELSTGIDKKEVLESNDAAMMGKKFIRASNIFIPPSAEDFLGLLYKTLAKGKNGQHQLKFYEKHLLKPYGKAMSGLNTARVQVGKNYRAIKEELSITPTDLKDKFSTKDKQGNASESLYTMESAVRVYMWNKEGFEIPGTKKENIDNMIDYVNSRPDLKEFANKLLQLQSAFENKGPNDSWQSGTITSDLMNTLNEVGRTELLKVWKENVDVIFSKQNMNKLTAAYGESYTAALSQMLARMETGRNSGIGFGEKDKDSNFLMSWLNDSVGVIMFLNMRSAVLQTISFTNFIDFEDNTLIAAAATLKDQKQYWKDFVTLWSSDYLLDRRDGLRLNVNEVDMAKAAEKDGLRGVTAWLLTQGYKPTKWADSFAISLGGASFYRTKINALEKKGMSPKSAEKAAMLEFIEKSETSQQSSRQDKLSNQQTNFLIGRTLLAFANTQSQYARIIKRSTSDIINRRGNDMQNVRRILYFGAFQSAIFNFLQQAIFAGFWGDDEEENNEARVQAEIIEKLTKAQQEILLEKAGYAKSYIRKDLNSEEKRVAAISEEVAKGVIKGPVAKKIEEKKAAYNKKGVRYLNAMVDGVLGGIGWQGKTFVTLKNLGIKLYEETLKARPDYARTATKGVLAISPPISSKIAKVEKIANQFQYNTGEGDTMWKNGWTVNNPALAVAANTAAIVNIPLDRALQKATNVMDAVETLTDDAIPKGKGIFMGLGWPKWQLQTDKQNQKDKDDRKKLSDDAKEKKLFESLTIGEQETKTLKDLKKPEQEDILKGFGFAKKYIKTLDEDEKIKLIKKERALSKKKQNKKKDSLK